MNPDLKRRLLTAMTGGAVAIVAVLVQWNEGIRHKPYKDGGDVLTVCYGHTGEAVIPNKRYTDEECQALLESDLKAAMSVVETQVTVPLTEMQKAGLASFVYNVGSGAFARSTLLHKLNSGDIQGACDEMRRWKYNEGKVSKGLVNRRAVEREICLPD
ncbi:lysozyme [Arsenophonus endosymbiont of Bemisia tabaci]|uniref:lysozyme n=1 Tax=Arsenophonus endosymbiont of Bemisia tabaci TaxID=536059 RepID=UPI0015F46C74|nr:lysozyme [Arsenophonus endosymbiont of Bemisia tabaci]CAA2931023.1 Lysozyme RrrD [Arsenophonus endosymbiont of Bemisia tabaci Q2]